MNNSKNQRPRLIVKDRFIESQTPLLTRDSLAQMLPQSLAEGAILELVDRKGKYAGTAYYGIQNKGIGWILSDNPRREIDLGFFESKLANAFQKRVSFLRDSRTNCFRVFNGEGDGIGGLTIDYYDAHFLVSYYSQGIYHFREDVRQAILKVAECRSIVEKRRFGDDQDGVVVYGESPESFVCYENKIPVGVDLIHGGMTGIFLDQREVRHFIRTELGKIKRMLNLFSYSALFSLFAIKGGVPYTCSVDLAPRSHELAAENFERNGISAKAHSLVCSDVFDFLKETQEKFDLVVVDPPSFSTSSGKAFSTSSHYGDLIEAVKNVSTQDATIILSTNNATISREKFRGIAETHLKILREFGLPADFRTHRNMPESNYLKVLVCKKK